MCILFFTHTTTPTSYVKWDRYNITFFNEFDITTYLNHFTGNFMPEYESCWCCSTTTYHVLVTATNICNYIFQYNTMLTFATNITFWNTWTFSQNQIRIFNILQIDFPWLCVHNTSVVCQCPSSFNKLSLIVTAFKTYDENSHNIQIPSF